MWQSTLLYAPKNKTEIKTKTGNHIVLIGADHLESEDQTKANERLAGLAVSPGVLDMIHTQSLFLIYDFICSLWGGNCINKC